VLPLLFLSTLFIGTDFSKCPSRLTAGTQSKVPKCAGPWSHRAGRHKAYRRRPKRWSSHRKTQPSSPSSSSLGTGNGKISTATGRAIGDSVDALRRREAAAQLRCPVRIKKRTQSPFRQLVRSLDCAATNPEEQRWPGNHQRENILFSLIFISRPTLPGPFQARSYVQARGGSFLLVPRRSNFFETQINVDSQGNH